MDEYKDIEGIASAACYSGPRTESDYNMFMGGMALLELRFYLLFIFKSKMQGPRPT